MMQTANQQVVGNVNVCRAVGLNGDTAAELRIGDRERLLRRVVQVDTNPGTQPDNSVVRNNNRWRVLIGLTRVGLQRAIYFLLHQRRVLKGSTCDKR